MSGMPVEIAVEQRNALAPTQILDQSTTRASVAYPGGARTLILQYRLLPGATAVTGQVLRIATNASSDLDAAGKLATVGGFINLCQGDDLTLIASGADPIYRVDVVAEKAVGAEKTLLQILAGV